MYAIRSYYVLRVGADEHALAGGEAVGLDHDRRALLAHVGLGSYNFV